MKLDPNEQHRRSIRLQGHDYSQSGAYFVTIVTAGRQCLFGQIVNDEMQLNVLGQVAQDQWEKLLKRFPHVELGAFVIMPNHIHGIVIIHGRRGTAGCAQDLDDESLRRAPTEQFGKPVPGSIPTIIRSYKSAVANRINLMRGRRGYPVWQRNYYEHIIRNEKDWDRIHRYIGSNPGMWAEDQENLLNRQGDLSSRRPIQ
ncbi:MAG: transposase [Anaerolineales bacterium]